MDNEFFELLYAKLTGNLVETEDIAKNVWHIPNLFDGNSKYSQIYEQISAAKDQLMLSLGKNNEKILELMFDDWDKLIKIMVRSVIESGAARFPGFNPTAPCENNVP